MSPTVGLFIILIYRFRGWKHRVDDGTLHHRFLGFLRMCVCCFFFCSFPFVHSQIHFWVTTNRAFRKVFMCIQETRVFGLSRHLLCATSFKQQQMNGGHNQMVRSSLPDQFCRLMLHRSWPLVTVVPVIGHLDA